MNKKAIFCIALILFLLLPGTQASADSSSLFRFAGTVQPVQNNNVRMVEEKVHIQVYAGWSVVRCEFLFRNESKDAQKVLMGFPASMKGVGGEIDETTRLKNFRVYDNGAELEAKLEKNGKENKEASDIAEWYTWDIKFQGGEEKQIVNTYKTQNYNAPWERSSGYILKTGAPWKGTIGKALITFELMDNVPSKIEQEYTLPKGFRVEQNKVIWEMQDFEPTEDICLILSGYIPISDIQFRDGNEQNDAVPKKVEEARALFMDGKEQEGLYQANLLLEQGVYAEELYFLLLNYYHGQKDTDAFMRVLKDQVQHLNSPTIFEWAKVLYPERIKLENITYPDNHKPVIENQTVRKVDDAFFELSADFYDEAGDMTFLSTLVYTDALAVNSVLLEGDTRMIFGSKNYALRAKGKLPDPYNDLICRMEVSDYKGDFASGLSIDGNRPGESCYFYTGDTFEMWNVKKDRLFTLCYYDKSFDPMEAEFRKTLSGRLSILADKLDITIPEGGYVINLYQKSHLEGLKRDAAQNITKHLKRPAYEAKHHNEWAAGKSEGQPEEWDWGEFIVELDPKNTERMVQDILHQVMAGQFGACFQQADSKVPGDFIAAVLGEPGKGRYYKAFSSMTKDELKKAALDIGISKTSGGYAASGENKAAGIAAVVLLALAAGWVIYVFVHKKPAKR